METLPSSFRRSRRSFGAWWLCSGLVVVSACSDVVTGAGDGETLGEGGEGNPNMPADKSGGVGGEAQASGGSGTTSGGSSGFFGLGKACLADDQCDSDHCVDGLCCESACDGPCMTCGSDGLCDDVPSDDAACGVVICPSDTECRNFPENLTANRCADLGECKTAEDCDYEDLPARTKCGGADTSEICNGAGECLFAEVTCGTETCSVDPGRCCQHQDGFTVECLSEGEACPVGPGKSDAFECNNIDDCPLGTICCHVSGASASPSVRSALCMEPIQCVSDQYATRTQVCSLSPECVSGTCELNTSWPAGYRRCLE